MTWEREPKVAEENPVSGKEEYFLSPETKAFLETRAGKCFLCKLILCDDGEHGKLTDDPMTINGSLFPVKSKLKHLELEKWIEKMCRGGAVCAAVEGRASGPAREVAE